MKEELITFETAVLAKEKGFDWKVRDAFVNGNLSQRANTIENCYPMEYTVHQNHNQKDHRISLPSQSLLQRWLCELHRLHITLTPLLDNKYTWRVTYLNPIQESSPHRFGTETYDTYETALEAALQTALKLIV